MWTFVTSRQEDPVQCSQFPGGMLISFSLWFRQGWRPWLRLELRAYQWWQSANFFYTGYYPGLCLG